MPKKVCVIGGGLGSLSGAIRLAKMGFQVSLYEKNAKLGGKMNQQHMNGYRFDTGPSLLTMPFVVDELFEFTGRNRSDYLKFIPLEILCEYFFSDGTRFKAYANSERIMDAIRQVFPGEEENYKNFMNYAKKIYDTGAEVFLFTPYHEMKKLFRKKIIPLLLRSYRIDPFNSVNKKIRRFFSDERLIQIFNRYATYNGSDPFQAPATLNIIPYVEYELGGYYIDSGMYSLVRVLEEIAGKSGISIHKNCKVEKIDHQRGRINGIRLNGEKISCDYILCGADVVYTHEELIKGFDSFSNKLSDVEPSLSGMVFLWGIDREYDGLSHHNIFFSENYREEFKQIFNDLSAPADPTIYISITSKTNVQDAPKGCENWFVLINMPYLANSMDQTSEITRMREVIIRKLSKFDLDIETHIETERVITPQDFKNLYASNRGSIYGLSSNSRLSAFRRPANRSRKLKGLFFAGGSVHPGGGIPLVLLSGKMAAELIAEQEGVKI